MNDVSFSRDDRSYLPLVPPLQPAGDPGERDTSRLPVFTQYFRIALRWKWLILGAVLGALLIGLLATLLATPQYTATTRIEINREGDRIVKVDDVQPEGAVGAQEFYQTQYGLLTSRSLAERIARELRLGDNAPFFAHFGAERSYEALTAGGVAASAGNRERRIQAAASILLSNVEVTPLRTSRLVDIAFTSPDPALSARISNTWATGFIQSNLERRFEATAYARRFLEQRLGQLRQRLDETERQLVGYASRQAIINIPVGGVGAGSTQERSLTADSLAALNAELAQATADRVRAQSRASSQAAATSAEALTNPTIASLRARRAEAAAEYSRMMAQFEPGYPPAQALAAQVARLDQSIAREEGRVRSSFDTTYRDSVERERNLTRQIDQLKQTFLDQRRRSIQYNILQREVDTNRQLYDGLLQRYKEIGIAGGVGTNNIAVVDPAQVPGGPSYPRPFLNMLAALLGGLILGIGLAFIREQVDETLTDPADLERKIGLPLLGAVPSTDAEDVLSELKDPKSSLIEAYLAVQTNLAFSTDHGIPRTLSVTSTRPGEGKSTTAYTMAYLVARNGKRTVLVDGDMRSPSVHHEARIGNEHGVSNYLSGTEDLDKLIQHPAHEPFAVLTAGPQPPNAAELLRSTRFEALLADLLKRFDHVVIDSPPVLGLADAPIIASNTEAVIFIIEARGVKARMAKVSLARLTQGRARIIGAVLTKFEAKRAHYGYGYDYGYGYGRDDPKTA